MPLSKTAARPAIMCSDCGTACTPQGCSTGYAENRETGERYCYQCSAAREKADLLEHGRGVFYVAPASKQARDATNAAACRRHALTTWAGVRIGEVCLSTSWPVGSYVGPRMYQAYATVGGREFTGRTFGEGLALSLRETAASKRREKAKS